ncbi:SAVMC3_10250 family protein [Kitasatospora sp. NPDC058406]|uniref:SAVMC3_10250 family protein n=1 Tax=Kitasatospora sp. NPDC058406 TaxID=3346483 RepID=UPI0036545674
MREFVYLSETKLSQFRSDRSPVPVPGAVGLTTPFGGVEVTARGPDAERLRRRKLRQVEKYLAAQADWFTAPGLRPGRWVRYEAPLRVVTLRGSHQDLVLFVDPAPGEDPEYDRESDGRLLLHGSAHHLVGGPPPAVDGPSLGYHPGAETSGGSFVRTVVGEVVRALELELALENGASAGAGGSAALPGPGVRDLLRSLDLTGPEVSTAARVAGYARVTAVLPATDAVPRCLVASPLGVEYHSGPR